MDESNTLESRLRKKLEQGEISQEEFDELYEKFKNLGILDAHTPPPRRKKAWVFTGSKVVDSSAHVNGPVTVNGSLKVKGDLECVKLNVLGSTVIGGDLTVIEKTNINGRLEIEGGVRSGGTMNVSGRLDVEGDVVLTSTMKVAGRVSIGGNLLVGENIKVGGKLTAGSIECARAVKVSGGVKTSGHVVAERFVCPSGNRSVVGSDLRARTIKIGSDRAFKVKGASPDISSLVQQIVSSFVADSHTQSGRQFEIRGDVEGENIQLNHVHVHGNVTGTNIRIGPGVTIDGAIYYREVLEVPSGTEYPSEKVAK